MEINEIKDEHNTTFSQIISRKGTYCKWDLFEKIIPLSIAG